MNETIDSIKKTRIHVLQLIKELTVAQLNEVPHGFNNNIIWNLSHLIASQQGVCYLRAGMPTPVDERFYQCYKPGTKPEGFIENSEAETIKDLMLSSLDRFATDYQTNAFANYNAWTTRYGVTLTDINDAIRFLLFHEGLHVGYIMALKRLVLT